MRGLFSATPADITGGLCLTLTLLTSFHRFQADYQHKWTAYDTKALDRSAGDKGMLKV